MQAQAYEGYFDKGNFFTAGRTIRLPENRRVFVTVLDEPAKSKSKTDEQERRLAWLKRLDELTELSMDEELIYIPRSQEMRPPLNLSD